MYKAPLKNFFLAKTTHRIPKLVTLAISCSVLVAMVNIDASASAFGGRDSGAVRSQFVLTLASESSNSQFSGLIKRWSTVTTTFTTPTAPPATVTTTSAGDGDVSGGGAGGGTSSGGGGGTGGGSAPSTTTTTSTSTTTTTTSPSAPTSQGLITAGPSRDECLIATTNGLGLPALQAAVNSFESLTGTTVTCIGTYNNADPTWSNWDDPWVIGPSGSAYTGWVALNPQVNQIVLEEDLIPSNLANNSNPLGWEQSCAAGDYDSYATTLAQNLVAAGLQNTVIRLGAEMNGPWENDYMGTTTQEQNLWATCFANEVTAMRQVSGENFLFDWNPNACYQNVPFANFYPGNAYVDIMGLDLYDQGCDSPNTALSFSALSNEPGGLTSFEAFAAAQGKPISFPEWGLDSSPAGDDPGYINGIGSTVENGDVAFQEYFDMVDGGTMLLGTNTPLSVAAYTKWFAGNS